MSVASRSGNHEQAELRTCVSRRHGWLRHQARALLPVRVDRHHDLALDGGVSMMDEDDVRDALYAGACATMKTAGYSQRGPTTPNDEQIAKFRRQLRAFLEVCPGEISAHELLFLIGGGE